ncbi:MFS transporter [Listeria costaricensis]|uniref:MFS transporter n=1 Tax=Listeria costaricensis TaxID=2026604 RepID=UPI000C06D728|nr:MFS transporter [Listeria costaricensis]
MFNILLAIIYLAFISLGLPDALLGSAWPSMYQGFDVPVSYAGIISMIIAFGTIISSLQSDRMTKKFGTGKITAFSVLLTAIALFGFSTSQSFWMLCLWAIPYGLGAGSVDASINNYVAIHYASRHMSWLHAFWGIGASIGPVIMGNVLSNGHSWNTGYLYIAVFQVALTAVLLISLPLWKPNRLVENGQKISREPLSLKKILQIPGAKASMITFFCYCALEQTTGLWASSYLVLFKHVPKETAATFAGLFFIGIAFGRILSGFMTMRFNDRQMIRLGIGTLLIGIVALILPFGNALSIMGLILIGLGCAPIYPSVIHATPDYFGVENSQAMIGVQMASAYIGTCLMPPLFGLIASHITVGLLPVFLFLLLAGMYVMHERLLKSIHVNQLETAASDN